MKLLHRVPGLACCCSALLSLIPLAVAQTPLVCGSVQSNSIATVGERDFYVYTASDREVVSIRMTAITTGLDARLELRDSTSNLLMSASGRIDRTLTNAGNYLIIALDQGNNETGAYTLTLQRLVNPCNPTPLTCGALTYGSVGAFAEMHAFTFPAAVGDLAVLKLTSLTEDFNPTMEVFDPAGNALTPSFGAARFGDTLANSGTHTAIVRYRFGSSQTGAYSLYFQNLTAPCRSSSIIPCGGLASGLQPPDSPVTYLFTGTAGDVVTVRVSTTTSPVQSWDIYEPDANVVTPARTTSTRTLSKTGNYLVVLYPPSGVRQIADYAISVNTVREPCAAVPLVCGAVQAGALTEAGEIHAYTFTGTAGEVISLRMASATEFFDAVFDLYDPDGLLATGSADYSELTPALLKSGQYTVLVHWKPGADSQLGRYGLKLQRITAPCAAEPVTLGTTMQAAFDEAGETALYTFTAGPGPVTICSRGTGGAVAPSLQLFTASGELVAMGSLSLQPNLDSNGTYRLLVKSPQDAPAGYFLRVSEGANDCPNFAQAFPSVTVFRPADGELVLRGAGFTVAWNIGGTNALATQEVWLSQNGGQSFTALVTNLPGNVRGYDWAVPVGASAAGWKLRVVAADTAGHVGAAETDGEFFAVNPPDQRGTFYEYDVLNQLISATYAPGQVQHYGYDAALNRSHLFGNADPNADTDGDGMPDAWEIAHNLDPGDSADGAADSDEDGMNNYVEYVACTDPRSPTSVLAINDVFRDDAATRITFRSRPGRTYVVEWTTNLLSGWTSLPPTTAEFDITTVTNTSGGSLQFYRVRLEPGLPCD